MSNAVALTKLRELHDQLVDMQEDVADCEAIDDETIDALGQLVTDIGELVDQAREKAEHEQIDPELHEDVVERIREFQSRHPSVTNFLSQLTDLLALIGI